MCTSKTLTSSVLVKKHITITSSAYEAADNTDAIVIATEWDEFKVHVLISEKLFASHYC